MYAKILIVDDHGLMRGGLRALLGGEPDFEVVGAAPDGRSALKMVAELLPDVVIMDLRMPELNGIDATRQAIAIKENIKIIALSANSEPRSVADMLKAGARGYVVKEAAFEELVTAIHTVLKNKVFLSPSVAGIVVDGYVGTQPPMGVPVLKGLSPREREVLQLIAEGKPTKAIAMTLHVSVKTAETHRRNVMEKLHVESVAELTKYAIREGLTGL